MARAYDGRKWQRPATCDCHKISYRDEAAALAAANEQAEKFDTPFQVYKCPGTRRWHTASRGFHPRALKSRARIMAWHLNVRRVIAWDGLIREIGLNPARGEDSNAKSAAGLVLREFARLGLVSIDDPRRPYITAVDHDGLIRVMMVGLQQYAEEHGVSTRRGGADE